MVDHTKWITLITVEDKKMKQRSQLQEEQKNNPMKSWLPIEFNFSVRVALNRCHIYPDLSVCHSSSTNMKKLENFSGDIFRDFSGSSQICRLDQSWRAISRNVELSCSWWDGMTLCYLVKCSFISNLWFYFWSQYIIFSYLKCFLSLKSSDKHSEGKSLSNSHVSSLKQPFQMEVWEQKSPRGKLPRTNRVPNCQTRLRETFT